MDFYASARASSYRNLSSVDTPQSGVQQDPRKQSGEVPIHEDDDFLSPAAPAPAVRRRPVRPPPSPPTAPGAAATPGTGPSTDAAADSHPDTSTTDRSSTESTPKIPSVASVSGAPPSFDAPFQFNIQYGNIGQHFNESNVSEWVNNLANGGQISANISRSGGAVNGNINIAPAEGIDPYRPVSMTSTSVYAESDISPTSSRASPRPMESTVNPMRFYPFPTMPLDPLSVASSPSIASRRVMSPPSHLGIQAAYGRSEAFNMTNARQPPHPPNLAIPNEGVANMSGYGVPGPVPPGITQIQPAVPPSQPQSAPPVALQYVKRKSQQPQQPHPAAAGSGGTRRSARGSLHSGHSASDLVPPSAARFVAIGIDFGTTFSGVAWAFSGNPLVIHDVKQYPRAQRSFKGHDEAQVPTQVDGRKGVWGFLVGDNHTPDKWFKLLLLRDEDIRDDIRNSPYLESTRQRVRPLGPDAVIDLVAQYLHHLWQHALREIEMQIDQRALQNLPFKVALTIPAIWPQYARNMMKEAARRAGILAPRDIADTTLILVEEPQAAALTTLLERREYPDMEVGETFMVVDCGGGTVDIISYKVMNTTPFVVNEVVKGEGKLCGAFLLDDKFEQYIKKKSGLKFENCEPAAWAKFWNDEWEHGIKRAFTGSAEQQKIFVHPPNKALSRIARLKGNDGLVIPRETVQGFFEESYQGIRSLINDQNTRITIQEGRPPKKIILVGGLGSSRYLSRKLATEYSNVMPSPYAWSAVARGAVIKLLKNAFNESDVVEAADPLQTQDVINLPEAEVHIARHSYGVETGVPVERVYPPVIEGVDKLFTDPSGVRRVWRMKWYLTQGEALSNHDPVSHKFVDFVNNAATRQTKFEIMTSDALPPPGRRDASCRMLCTIRCDYDRPFHELPVADDVQGMRVVKDMRLTMTFEGEPQWRLQVGNKVTDARVDVDFED